MPVQIKSNFNSNTIAVLSSGGVDSSVAALLLKNQGYDLVSVYLKCWSIEQLDKLNVDRELYNCHWEDDMQDAKLVAKKLDIPFLVIDLQKEYLKKVIGYTLDEYKKGYTPNPDVMCNFAIKFGSFLDKIKDYGIQKVATGHYAKIVWNATFKKYFLAKASNQAKDQSYFLNRIKPDLLPKIHFPLSDFKTKREIRDLAKKNNLITANKKDSQGLCFVGKTSLRDLLKAKIGQKEGDILEIETNQKLGSHPGAFLYTIGQREKLGLSDGPWYVCKIDVEQNQVFVTHHKHGKSLETKRLIFDNVNFFIKKDVFLKTKNMEAQIRYHGKFYSVKSLIELENNQFQANFESTLNAVTKGQSIVFYSGENILAGGIIALIFSSHNNF